MIRKVKRYLKNRLMKGSVCMYQDVNSRIDHVTYRATGVKMMEYISNLKLMFTSNVRVFIQVQLVMIVSAPSSRKRHRGIRLMKKAVFTAVLTCERGQFVSCGEGLRVVRRGKTRIIKMIIRQEAKMWGVVYIAATWICTKSFWFLRPTDELLSFRSWIREGFRVQLKLTKISSFRCCERLSVNKGALTPVFRITT